ncbi:hypothetical protein FPCIR_11796 [Fusarium pseudocircinatum]|uniref:Uncharacterized protein n=1 Tax=Fusarium pseudocircinatum TaxID=56676 RepID=A0A8H5KPC6_9HYPO|nr:hypothetical protein FPCIR_11796 [Fusarium pseudocircinatum]
MQLNWVFLLVASLASLAACDLAKFINPPAFAPVDDFYRIFGNNLRYKEGEVVEVVLSHFGDVGNLSVSQLNTAIFGYQFFGDVTKLSQLTKSKIPRHYLWTAMYDIANFSQNGEDTVYFFKNNRTAQSAYFNVSMADSRKSKSPAASKTTSLVRESSTSQSTTGPGPDSTDTEKPSRKEKNRKEKNRKGKNRKEKQASAKSGLTGGEVAGITIGAVVAFALILCGFCWGFDRMRVAKQLQKSHEFELRNMERDVRALRETVSKLGA